MFDRSSLLFLLFTCIFGIHYCRAYVPQQPLVEPLTPIGIRISIPHDEGITLVAFHVKFNDDFNGLEAGTIARDVLVRKNGRWTYEDRSTILKRGDVVYYWIHVVYNGLGYNLINQRYTVTDFYDYKGQRIVSDQDGNDNDNAGDSLNPNGGCINSLTRLYDIYGNSRYPCAGQLLYEDDFRDMARFRRMQWNVVEQFADLPDYEFVVYRNSPMNLNVQNGLKITPKLLKDEHDNNFILSGSLTLNQCTKKQGTTDCYREAQGYRILPPITAARVDTRNSFIFEHARVEIRAKFPRGDWIYPLLMLEPTDTRSSMQIRIASANGNADLKTRTGKDISGHVLWGGITGLNPNSLEDRINENTATRYSRDLWSTRFHTYELTWSPNRIVLSVDGDVFEDRQINLPRDTPCFLTLGLAVGGLSEFPDNCTSRSYVKTWRNVEAKALYHFFNSTDLWYNTWETNANSLEIDYVKIYAL